MPLLPQNGCSALHGASASGQLEVVNWMLNYPGIDKASVDDVRTTLCARGSAAYLPYLSLVSRPAC